MQHHSRFLLALSADPFEDANRLVYADWLEEQGHPLAELLRLQVRIRSLPERDPQVLELADRERVLLEEHADVFFELGRSLEDQPEAQKILSEGVLDLSDRHPVRFACPGCFSDRAFRLGVKNPMCLHWIVNPGLAFNELVLGQRAPAVMLVCRTCMLGSVRCVACRRLLPIQSWDRPFGNWSGLRCPDCGSPIPMLRNLVAGLVVGVGKLAVGVARKEDVRQPPV